jgi:zinc protease
MAGRILGATRRSAQAAARARRGARTRTLQRNGALLGAARSHANTSSLGWRAVSRPIRDPTPRVTAMKSAALAVLLGLSLAGCILVAETDEEGLHGLRIRSGWSHDSEHATRQASALERSTSRAVEASAPAGVQRDGLFPYPVHQRILGNGLKLIVVPMPSEGLASYWSIVRTGSRDEVEKGVTGFAHFFEHMMFRGTEKLPGDAYDKIVNGMGADANAFTSNDITAYHLGVTKDDIATVAEIESDRFQNLKYDEGQFQTEAGAVYGEYRKGKTNPFEVLEEAIRDAAFDVHTYEHTTIGFEADIAAMPQQFGYSKTFFQRFYRPENVVILVAGDVEPGATFALLESKYGAWKKGYVAPKVAAEPEQSAERRIDVPFEGQTLPILQVGFKGERFLPKDRRMVAATLLEPLYFGETSELYEKLVLDEQRCQFVAASFGASRDPDLWSVYAMVKEPADVAAVEGEIWSAIQQAVREVPTEQQLDDARSRLKYGFLSGLATPSGVCESVAFQIALTGGLEWIDDFYATLATVTPEDVRAAAAHYLKSERSTVAALHAQDAPLPAPTAGAEPPVLVPVAADPNVAVKVWFKVGSQDDPPGKEGLAALTATLISEGGTKSRTYDEILARLFPLAAGYGVSVDKEMTVASGSVHRDKVSEFVELFLDALVNPGFRAEDFERLRDDALSSIENQLRYSSDEELGKAALVAKVFAGTPYAHIGTGTVESLRAFTLEDVQAFWSQHFTKDNLVLALGGAYPSDLLQRLEAELARLPAGKPASVATPVPPRVSGRNVVLVEKPGNTTAISMGVPIDVHRGSREFYALWIANSWLGEHRNSSSHLYQVIREARGMNYGDYSYIEAFPNGGRRSQPPQGVGRRAQMFELWIRPVADEQAVFALRAALREVDRLVKDGLTKEQFEFTKGFLEKYSLHFAETTAERLGYAIDDRYFGLATPHLPTFRKMMKEITLEETNAAIRRYFQTQDLVIALVTADAEAMKHRLVSDEPSPITYPAPKPPEIVSEDEQIARYPLSIEPGRVTIVPVEEMFEKSGRASG